MTERPTKHMRSLIHNNFEVDGASTSSGPAKAQCVTCGVAIVCADGNTSSCRKHLQTKHPEQYSELLGKEDAKKLKVRILTLRVFHACFTLMFFHDLQKGLRSLPSYRVSCPNVRMFLMVRTPRTQSKIVQISCKNCFLLLQLS